jgi:hypothetical protein
MADIPSQQHRLHMDSKQIALLMGQMAGDSKFQVFFDQIHSYRESAIADLCNDAVVSDVNKVFAAIGEIRAYTAFLSIAGSQAPRAGASEGETG